MTPGSPRGLLLALVLVPWLGACDSSAPSYGVRAGAAFTFAYEHGPAAADDGPDGSPTATFRVEPGAGGASGYGVWTVSDHDPAVGLSALRSRFALPLSDAPFLVRDAGIYTYARTTCDLYSGGSRVMEQLRVPFGTTSQVRVKRGCAGTSTETYTVTRDVPVSVPAGTFATVRLDRADGRAREFWSPEVGLVRLDALDGEGGVRASLVLARAD